jgi:hypothetical protein
MILVAAQWPRLKPHVHELSELVKPWVHRVWSPPDAEPEHEPSSGGYAREAWPHWDDDDRDCQDTRQEVLIEESLTRVTLSKDGCKVTRGRWRCPFTGRIITDPGQLDIDHLVPLKEAHRSGGAAWSRSERRRYANDRSTKSHLVAVDRGANRSKGDRDPSAWLPAARGFRCGYLERWVAVKRRWALDMDPVEQAAIARMQAICAAGGIPERPNESGSGQKRG